MIEQTRAAATSVDWSTVVLKETDPPPPRPAENLLMSVLFGLVLLSAGGAVFTVIPLLFAGAAGALAALTGVDTRVLSDHADALWALAGATTAMILLCGTAGGGLSAIEAARNKRRPREITGTQLAAAPDEVRELMRDAVLAVETIQGSSAWREGLFTDVNLKAATWDIGSRVLAATELHDAITAAGESDGGTLSPTGDPTYRQACARIADAVQALRNAADAVEQLSGELDAADAVAQVDAERAERAGESAKRFERLAAAQATTPIMPATAVTDLSDTITTRTLAYRDVRNV